MKEVPFKSMVYGNKPFNPEKLVFGEKEKSKLPLTLKRQNKSAIGFKHEAPFKPSNPPKSGEQGYIGKFPAYKGNPMKVLVRKDTPKGKDAFKLNNPEIKAKPSPSITLFSHNIRREISKSAGKF